MALDMPVAKGSRRFLAPSASVTMACQRPSRVFTIVPVFGRPPTFFFSSVIGWWTRLPPEHERKHAHQITHCIRSRKSPCSRGLAYLWFSFRLKDICDAFP